MGGGGNPTWIKYLGEKKDDSRKCSALIQGIPNNVWMAFRIKALTKGLKINAIGIKLFEKWVKNEIEI